MLVFNSTKRDGRAGSNRWPALLGALLATGMLTCFAGPSFGQSTEDKSAATTMGSDGSVPLDGTVVPLSNLLSPEGHAYLRRLITQKPFASGQDDADIKTSRARGEAMMKREFLDAMRRRFAVDVVDGVIGGVPVQIVTPTEGIRSENRHRLLLNVHGGGFNSGAHVASLVEAIPLAATMGIKVISIDYRLAPEHSFPAASEDVAAVYREVLKTYKSGSIGLYGCSAGGMLTGQSVAWFQTHSLPAPGAIGVFCAALGQIMRGDSSVLANPLSGAGPGIRPTSSNKAPPAPTYFRTARDDDPLAFPETSPSVLAKFPPTLFVTGTRSFEFSSAVHSNNKLRLAGVDSQLQVWDGMFHGFFYNSELPESREAYSLMVDFFSRHLKR